MSSEETHEASMGATGLARLAIGLLQGLALYFLYHSVDDKIWPATDPLVFAPLLLVLLYVPLLALLGIGNIRLRTLIPWLVTATGVTAGLAWYDMTTHWPAPHILGTNSSIELFPSVALLIFIQPWLFIGHVLVAGGDADRRIEARYPTHFDIAWKLIIQYVLSGIFTGIFWLVLLLGAALFRLINLDFFEKLLGHPWFSIPATTMATALAIHLTDVRAGLVRGTRTLILVLFSWLLPVLALIVGGFLLSLPFTGLAPLWKFGHASALLLATAAVLVILINATHQDGQNEPPKIMRIAGSVACVLLLALAAIAGYALMLRVQQYGWTADRVATAACVVVAAFYAVGYALAALPGGAWLGRIERWNFLAALLVLAVVVALFTPLADPNRIGVADQMARLKAGKVAVAQFDFYYLARSGRYGHDALLELSRDKSSAIRDAASIALNSNGPYIMPQSIHPDIGSRIAVYPKGRTLPPGFLKQLTGMDMVHGGALPGCVYLNTGHCRAFFLDVDGDGVEEILLTDAGSDEYNPSVFRLTNGRWDLFGHFNVAYGCHRFYAALLNGTVAFVPPVQAPPRDAMAGTMRFPFEPARQETPLCP